LTLGGLASCVFVGWGIKKEKLRSFTGYFLKGISFDLWLFSLRFLAPVTVIVILLHKLFRD
ncbi:sodium-dependent transporter, partial [Helicobacter sp. faydin-H20]|nr:sodium-dependent transporter [Helicobacter anatolicus]